MLLATDGMVGPGAIRVVCLDAGAVIMPLVHAVV